jgi:hypothetical protein
MEDELCYRNTWIVQFVDIVVEIESFDLLPFVRGYGINVKLPRPLYTVYKESVTSIQYKDSGVDVMKKQGETG